MPDNASQPFREEDVLWRWTTTEKERKAVDCPRMAYSYTYVRIRDGIMLWMEFGTDYLNERCSYGLAELLRQLAAKDERIAELQTEVEAHQLFGCPKHETIPSARNGSDWLRSIEKSHPDLTDDDRLHLQHVADGFDSLCQISGEQEAETAHLRHLLRKICPYDHSDTFKSPPTEELRRTLWKDIREALK